MAARQKQPPPQLALLLIRWTKEEQQTKHMLLPTPFGHHATT
jgi:hypothetical protein